LKIARHDPRIATTIHDWDNDPVAMSAAGVHVDLRTGSTRPLEPTDLMLRRASVPPVRIPTPIWDKFMWETFDGDTDLITFVHQWFGYCLSGDTSAEKLAFLHGTGGNGKGVVIHTVSEIAGSYAVMLGSDMFMQRKHEEHPTEIARLAGARMAIGSEISDGARWNLRRLKELTGHEGNLHGRFMRRDFFEFKPTHKLTLVGNHKPAIARRLLMLPFEHMPKKMDPSLKDRLVPEYPGILWKLIEGCGEVLAALADGGAGFGSLIPQAVVKASREYFVEEDNVALWMSEQCEAGTGYSMMSNEAHTNYEAWCGDEGLPPVSQRMFKDAAVRAAEIAGMSITCRRTKKGVVLVGARLKPVN
jgi:putative DNA primase/helicase